MFTYRKDKSRRQRNKDVMSRYKESMKLPWVKSAHNQLIDKDFTDLVKSESLTSRGYYLRKFGDLLDCQLEIN